MLAAPGAKASLKEGTGPSAESSTPEELDGPARVETEPSTYETLHVHEVYDQIASHFSATRYKPWPMVSRFLQAQSPGSVGVDIGCGNGKYFGINPNVLLLGSDRSLELVRFARTHSADLETGCSGQGMAKSLSNSNESLLPSNTTVSASERYTTDALVADSLSLPHPSSAFDFAISVAVIHHLSTRDRRVQALEALLNLLRPAECQTPNLSRLQSYGPGDNESLETALASQHGGKVFVCVWALEQKDSRRGWDKGMEQDVLVPWVMKSPKGKHEKRAGLVAQVEERTFQRFYHLYREGELEEDVVSAGGEVLAHGYEKDNWWAVAYCKSTR